MYFSVIVPVYKAEMWLRPCVASVLEQSFGDFELILVDDGSPDRCPVICDELAAGDERVRAVHTPNRGPVHARQTGMDLATGIYLVCLDADDALAPGALETFHDLAERFGADVILSARRFEYPHGQEIMTEPLAEGLYGPREICQQAYPFLLMDRKTRRLAYYMTGQAVRRELMRRCHARLDLSLRFGEDMVCMLYVYRKMRNLYVTHQVTYRYRVLPQSLSHRLDERQFEQFLAVLGVLRGMEAEFGGDFSARVDRYAAHMSFVLLVGASRVSRYAQVKWLDERMQDPRLRDSLSRAEFDRLSPKAKIAQALMRLNHTHAAFEFLRLCALLKKRRHC